MHPAAGPGGVVPEGAVDHRGAALREVAHPAARVGLIHRVDGKRVVTVTANVAEGVQTTRSAIEIARELGVELPITEQLISL